MQHSQSKYFCVAAVLFYTIFNGMPSITPPYLCNAHSPNEQQKPTANYPTAPFHFSLHIDVNICSLKLNVIPYRQQDVTKASTECWVKFWNYWNGLKSTKCINEQIYLKCHCRSYMFRRRSCAIFRELTVPDQICYTNVMDVKIGDSESRCWLTGRCPAWHAELLFVRCGHLLWNGLQYEN
jgi:hypothetical protein